MRHRKEPIRLDRHPLLSRAVSACMVTGACLVTLAGILVYAWVTQ